MRGKSGVEIAGDGLSIHVYDEITIISHLQRGLGLLVGDEPGSSRRADGLFRRPYVEPLVLIQVPLRGLPHDLECVSEPHDGGVALDNGTPGVTGKLVQGCESGFGLDEPLA